MSEATAPMHPMRPDVAAIRPGQELEENEASMRAHHPTPHEVAALAPAPASSGTQVPVIPERPDRGQPHVLVVDDVYDNRDILTRRLTRRGFAVDEASGGCEALEKLKAQDFDLVLLDIMMPDMCGNEVLRAIRRTHSALQLPVIMVTAKSHSEDVVESLDLGANDYITKPVDFAVALARISSQLARKFAAEEEARARRAVEQNAEALRRTNADLEAEALQRRLSEERLQRLAYLDGLTGLLNRTAFRERAVEVVDDAMAEGRDPAIVFIDLDRFKAINDVYGHEAGDNLLGEVAARLRALVGDRGYVARLGGDEFGILLKDTTRGPDAGALAEAVVRTLCEPFPIGDRVFQIGASCGVAQASDVGWRLEILLKAADLAMYRAKSRGRSRFTRFDPCMMDEMKERSAMEVALREAIRADAIDVHYQPIIDARTRHLTSCEALARWAHPERGLILPELFIPLAEETGQIMALGTQVLRKACAEAARWPDDVGLAVNLSPLQFRNHDLIDVITSILAETGLAPQRLELEITETALLEARDSNFDILRSIRSLGIRVAMDDFGTGYSSLSYLQNFEFDKIKVDRRFVAGLKPGADGAAIIKAIAELGTTVGVSLTAEGVETDEELAVVSSYGCREIQGFLFSHPLTAEDVRAYVAHRTDPGAPRG
jgi:diguanylate cyclase (GGDEF)-like protein